MADDDFQRSTSPEPDHKHGWRTRMPALTDAIGKLVGSQILSGPRNDPAGVAPLTSA
jgi:hypothetical protein